MQNRIQQPSETLERDETAMVAQILGGESLDKLLWECTKLAFPTTKIEIKEVDNGA